MPTTSLRTRALPIGVALALTSLAGVVGDVVGVSQVLAMGGELPLLILWPLSGVGLAIPVIVLVPVIDRWPRLLMLRRVGLGLAALDGVALALALASEAWGWGTWVTLSAVTLIWVAAAVQNYLYPMLLWSLAADVFNVNESRRINGWIASWLYVGQLAALVITVASPALLARASVSLMWLLAIPPIMAAAIAVWLPRKFAGAATAGGLSVSEGIGESLRSGWQFVRGIPVWWLLLIASVVTSTSSAAIALGVTAGAEYILGAGAGTLQVFLGAAQLVATLGCLAVQRFVAVPVAAKIGINGALLVLPISLVVAGVSLTWGIASANLWLVALASMFWRIPEWTIDSNARTAMLGFVPDQRRARVSLIFALGMFALGWSLSALLAAPGLLAGPPWLLGVLPAVTSAASLVLWVKVYRTWDTGLLNWRLRRRKRTSLPDLEDG